MSKHSVEAGRRLQLGLSALVVMVVLYLLTDALGREPTTDSLWRLVVEFLISGTAAIIILSTARVIADRDRTISRSWTLIGLGHLAYAAGDLIAAAGIPLASNHLSWLMNAGYLSYYPLVIAGVLSLPLQPAAQRDRIRVLLDLLVVSVSAIIVLWYLVAEPLVMRPDSQLSYGVLTVIYVAGDVGLAVAVLSIGLRCRRISGLLPAVGWLLASATAMFLADWLYAGALLGQVGALHGAAGFSFMLGHLLAAVAVVHQQGALSAPAPRSAPPTTSWWPSRTGLSLFLAYSSLAAACVVQMTGTRHGTGFVDVVPSLLVIFLVAARQWLEFRDNARLNAEAERARGELELRVRQRTADLEKANRELARNRDELEGRVAARTRALHQSNRELEAFAYSVSHDLRAPLRGIDGFSALLLEDHSSQIDDEGKRILARICAAATRMGRLIDDLLRLSRISRTASEEGRLDLSERARRIGAEVMSSSGAAKVELRIADGLEAWGDGRLVDLALHNLLSNAAKFSADRDPIVIELGAAPIGEGVAFFVRDNGVGFDMQYADKLFAPFQRLHSPERFEGTGVGLATVDRIVRRHGGRVWAESTPGEGATFFFTLRGARVADHDAAEREPG